MKIEESLLQDAATRGIRYLREIDKRRVFPAQPEIDRPPFAGLGCRRCRDGITIHGRAVVVG